MASSLINLVICSWLLAHMILIFVFRVTPVAYRPWASPQSTNLEKIFWCPEIWKFSSPSFRNPLCPALVTFLSLGSLSLVAPVMTIRPQMITTMKCIMMASRLSTQHRFFLRQESQVQRWYCIADRGWLNKFTHWCLVCDILTERSPSLITHPKCAINYCNIEIIKNL